MLEDMLQQKVISILWAKTTFASIIHNVEGFLIIGPWTRDRNTHFCLFSKSSIYSQTSTSSLWIWLFFLCWAKRMAVWNSPKSSVPSPSASYSFIYFISSLSLTLRTFLLLTNSSGIKMWGRSKNFSPLTFQIQTLCKGICTPVSSPEEKSKTCAD